MKLTVEESDFAGWIPEGTPYAAQVIDVRRQEKKYVDKETGQPVVKLAFRFKLIADDDHDGQELWGETGIKLVNHPNCKLYNWAEAILGRPLPAGVEFDTDDLVDRRCKVIVGLDAWSKNGEEQKTNRVRDVQPTRAAAEALAAAGVQDDEPF